MGHHSLGCAVEHLPMTMRCQSRERVLAWYAAHETVCLDGRAEHDNFQFGVPSEMGSIAANSRGSGFMRNTFSVSSEVVTQELVVSSRAFDLESRDLSL